MNILEEIYGIPVYVTENVSRDTILLMQDPALGATTVYVMHPVTEMQFRFEGHPFEHLQAVCDWYADRACRELDAMLERLLADHGLLPIGGAA